jgi:alkylation response protein AidB-like acyl-CoA dehydrogenase
VRDFSAGHEFRRNPTGSAANPFKARAERDGDEWIINGEKWFI